MRVFFKAFYPIVIAALMSVPVAGCSTNPATGESQFAALMSPQQEARVGAQEHANILRQYGGLTKDQALQNYVTGIGQKLAANTERSDVAYQFFVLDSPVINAFALPGGYVYVTRGIVALANTEAQLASVLAHEIGHVTARHSAERYSHGVVSSLGATILAAALDSKAATQALGVGSNLYISSYSRQQESQSDELGIRYLHRAGYDPAASSQFLTALGRYTAFEAQADGKNVATQSYFSTHPQTAERAAQAASLAASYPALAGPSSDRHLQQIDGMIFGDSPEQGFIRNTTFWHPGMGFTFTAPNGYVLANTSTEVIAKDPASGTIILFDSVPNSGNTDAATYLSQIWMKGEPVANLENVTIGGKRAATGSFPGKIGNAAVTVRLVAIEWAPGTFFRFQMAVPPGASPAIMDGLKNTTYSLRPMTTAEQSQIRPQRLKLVTAKAGDSVTSLSVSQPFPTLNEQRFRALNNIGAAENVVPGRVYKVITE